MLTAEEARRRGYSPAMNEQLLAIEAAIDQQSGNPESPRAIVHTVSASTPNIGRVVSDLLRILKQQQGYDVVMTHRAATGDVELTIDWI